MEACDPPSTSLKESARLPLCVDVIRRCPAWSDAVEDARLAEAANAAYALSAVPQDEAEVSLLLADDAEIRRLNASWRGRDSATNVLSFPLDQPPAGDETRHLGDIVLAFETVSREAMDKNIPLAQHAAHLVVHGLLHLLGYDHEITKDAEEMEHLEVKILARLGMPDPYLEEAMESGEIT